MAHTHYFGRALATISSTALISLIKFYRFWLSPWVGQHCRFSPSCSLYAIEAIQSYGCWYGTGLTLKRLARCHPWCEGGYDPVPKK